MTRTIFPGHTIHPYMEANNGKSYLRFVLHPLIYLDVNIMDKYYSLSIVHIQSNSIVLRR